MAVDPGESHTRFAEGWPAHSWDTIERLYQESNHEVMADLARRVRASDLGRSLGGLVSMYSLRCMMHQQIYTFEPSLLVTPNPDGTVTFTYDMSSGTHDKDWTATYPSDQVFSAFSGFLKRVGWVPEGHPAHDVIEGRS